MNKFRISLNSGECVSCKDITEVKNALLEAREAEIEIVSIVKIAPNGKIIRWFKPQWSVKIVRMNCPETIAPFVA